MQRYQAILGAATLVVVPSLSFAQTVKDILPDGTYECFKQRTHQTIVVKGTKITSHYQDVKGGKVNRDYGTGTGTLSINAAGKVIAHYPDKVTDSNGKSTSWRDEKYWRVKSNNRLRTAQSRDCKKVK